MKKPRMEGQSIIEYLIILVIVAVISVAFIPRIPRLFSGYVESATGRMK